MSRANEMVSPVFNVKNGFAEHVGEAIRTSTHGGLTIREHFAAMAMQALIGTAAAPCLTGGLGGAEQECAKGAVKMAEALIAELAKVQP